MATDPRGGGELNPHVKTGRSRRVGYVVSTYPAYSHAFIQTEIDALAADDWEVQSISINRPQFPDPRGSRATFVIKTQSISSWIRTAGRSAFSHPGAVVGVAAIAIRSGLARRRGVRGVIWAVAYLLEALSAFDVARRRRIPHLHAHFANSGADVAWLAAEFGKRAGAHSGPRSFSMTVHGPSDFDDAVAIDLAGKTAAARDVVTISDYASSTLLSLVPSLGAAKLHVIRMGVTVDAADGSSRPPQDSGSFRVLFVGRLVEKKAPDVLLGAIRRLDDLQARLPVRIEATFVGAGPLLESVAAEARSLSNATVEFVGAMAHDDVLAMYPSYDVFCLPSYSEGLPVVLMEAMASGVAVITTPVAAIPELVEDGISGLLVPPGDAEALAGALRHLAMEPADRAALAERGRRAVRRLHDARASSRRLQPLFAEDR